MSQSIICQACGVEAPTKYISFYQNIGALVVRFHKTARGNLCKNCVHSNYWKMTGTTLGIGWLGYISIIVAPIFVIMNTVNYLRCLGMPGVPAGARVPSATPEVIAKLAPHSGAIIARLERGEELQGVAFDVAPQAGTTPGEVIVYVIQMAQMQRAAMAAQQQQRTGGFPVVMPANAAASAPAIETAARITPPPLPVNA